MRLQFIACAVLALLPAAAQEEIRNYPLGPIGGQFHVTPNSSYARIVSLDSAAPGITSGLQVGDYVYGAFGKTFTPTGTYHNGVTQELGFAVDRAEGAGGTLPLKVLRPGVGPLDISVTLPAAGAFGPAYPRASIKHQAAFESACAWLHQKVMSTSNGDVGYPTGWTGLCLLGHPNWNDTTGAKPYRLSINKIRDRCVNQITTGLYASVEDKLFDGTANPNYVGGALSNWQLGQMVMFLSEYYAKTADATVVPTIQRGAEMCANTVQWWKQPALGTTYSPEGTEIAGIVSHGGVIGDYIHLGWGGGINIVGCYTFNGMAFARHAGVNMSVRPRDGHYFGYTNPPAGAVEVGKENYDPSIDEKFQMQWNWMGKRCAYYNASSPDDGHVAYTLNAPSSYDAAGRTPGTVLGMSFYKRDGGILTADEDDKLARLKAYISRQYIRQQESHAYCLGAQSYQALATSFLSDRQQRFALDNWRFYYALARTPAGGFQYFRARTVDDSYLDETQCAAIDMAMPYVVANGGLNSIPAINGSPNQVIANFLSPDISWPNIAARKISLVGGTLAMPVNLVDGQGAAVSSGYTASWTKVSGPGTVTFSQPSAATTDITFSATGNYRVQLTVVRGSYTLVEPIDVSVRLNTPPAGYAGGVVNYQVYTGISGTTVANLTGAAKFPNSPDITRTVTSLAGDYSGDNYGARLSGCIIAPVTGPYRFYIASDDSSQLKFNSSGLATPTTVIASVSGSTSANQWNKFASQQSAVINLTAGQAYSFEALHKEGTGGDLVSVGWSINGGAIEVIDGVYLAAPDSTPATMSIVAQPQPASTTLGGSVTLSVSTTGPQPGFYQWRRNGVNMGAPSNSPALTFSNVSGGAQGSYDCVYTTTLGSLTSSAVQVTVTDAGNLVTGGLWREVYTGISGSAVTDLTTNAKFPVNADSSGPITSATAPSDYADDYGQRITGWINPTVSGNYRFYLTADDSAELWLGTNEQATTKTRLVQITSYTDPKAWSQHSPSAYIALQAGKYYYLEIRHKESGGGDNCAAAWQRQGDPAPVNGTGEIPGQYLSYRVGGSFDDLAPGNQAPFFVSDPIDAPGGYAGVSYTAPSLATLASDFNSADTLVFSKLTGPSWLSVASNGTLSGTPQLADLGVNTFTVRVADPAGLEDIATLTITVTELPPNPVWTNAAGGSWPGSGNWLANVIANGQDKTADFSTLDLTANATVTLDGARTIGGLRFGDTTPSHDWALNTGTGGPLTLAVPSGSPTIFVANRTTTIGTVLTGSQGLIKTGAGALTLTPSNTLTGPVTISQGTVSMSNSGSLGTGTITLGDASTGAADAGWLFPGGGAPSNTVIVSTLGSGKVTIGTLSGGFSSPSFALTLNRPVTLQDSTGDRTSFSGKISGSVGTLTLAGTRVTFDNGTNNFVGNVEVSNATTYQNNAAGAIPDATDITLLGSTAKFRLNNNSETIGALNGNGTVDNVVGSNNTLTVGGGDRSGTFGGVIANGTGTLNLAKTGTGSQALGGANTYTGTTNVSGGSLLVNGSLATTATTVGPAGTLGGSGSIAGTVANNGTLAPGNNAVGNLTVNNTLTLAGGSKMIWEISNWTGAAGTGWDKATVTALNLTATAASPVTIRPVDLALANFTEASASFVLIQTTSGITGFSADKFTVDTGGLTAPRGTWAVQQSGNNLVLAYTASPDINANGIVDNWEIANFGNADSGANRPGDDDDKDGLTNLMEFALNTNPKTHNAGPVVDLETVGGTKYLRIIVNKNPQATNLVYSVESCSGLNDWSTADTVIETSPSNQLIVRDSVPMSSAQRRFIRLKVRTNP